MSRQLDARLARGANRSRPNEKINLSYEKAVQGGAVPDSSCLDRPLEPLNDPYFAESFVNRER